MLLKLDDEINAAYKTAASAAECAKVCRLPEERDGWLTLKAIPHYHHGRARPASAGKQQADHCPDWVPT
jgi:hypothetical protein